MGCHKGQLSGDDGPEKTPPGALHSVHTPSLGGPPRTTRQNRTSFLLRS